MRGVRARNKDFYEKVKIQRIDVENNGEEGPAKNFRKQLEL